MMSKNAPRPAPEPPALWPPAPLGTPPAYSLSPRRRTLLGSAGLDAALGIPLGVVLGTLLATAEVTRQPPFCDRNWVVGPCVAGVVNLALCLVVGRRFRALGVGMAVASSAIILVALWCFWYPSVSMCRAGMSDGAVAGE